MLFSLIIHTPEKNIGLGCQADLAAQGSTAFGLPGRTDIAAAAKFLDQPLGFDLSIK